MSLSAVDGPTANTGVQSGDWSESTNESPGTLTDAQKNQNLLKQLELKEKELQLEKAQNKDLKSQLRDKAKALNDS